MPIGNAHSEGYEMIAILIVIITAIVDEGIKPEYVITDVKITPRTDLVLREKEHEENR